MHFVYILYTTKLDKYYTGQTHDVKERLERHNTSYYGSKWTERGKPWSLALVIECSGKGQALSIERHIKKMKSRKYMENLMQYPEMVSKLKEKFPPDC